MNEKLSVNLTGKDAAKLLEGLAKDPQLRSEDDPSILAEEQFPTDHHAMLQGKTIGSSTDNIIITASYHLVLLYYSYIILVQYSSMLWPIIAVRYISTKYFTTRTL